MYLEMRFHQLGVIKETVNSFNERHFRPSFLGKIPAWEIMFFSLLISSPHLLKYHAFHSVS